MKWKIVGDDSALRGKVEINQIGPVALIEHGKYYLDQRHGVNTYFAYLVLFHIAHFAFENSTAQFSATLNDE